VFILAAGLVIIVPIIRIYRDWQRYLHVPQYTLASTKRWVEKEPNNSKAHRTLGEMWWSKRKYTQAIYELQAAVKLDPNDTIAHFELGEILNQIGKKTEAQSEWRTVKRIAPNSSWAREAQLRLQE